jgi:hypothetical protein
MSAFGSFTGDVAENSGFACAGWHDSQDAAMGAHLIADAIDQIQLVGA